MTPGGIGNKVILIGIWVSTRDLTGVGCTVSLGGRFPAGCEGVAEYGGERSSRIGEGVRPEAGNVDASPLVVKS